MKLKLSTDWKMNFANFPELSCSIPCSVYSVLLDNKLINDPFWRTNEEEAFSVSENDSVFNTCFEISENDMAHDEIEITFDSIDTIAEVFLNNNPIITANNMHSSYTAQIKNVLKIGKNILNVSVSSPLKYIKEQQEKYELWGTSPTVDGFSHIRKPHYMFGWDWGPKLPDMGIPAPVTLNFIKSAKLETVEIRQIHGGDSVILNIKSGISLFTDKEILQKTTVVSPRGSVTEFEYIVAAPLITQKIDISEPQLWWPNGYGKQNLYTIKTELFCDGELIDDFTQKIGLRTLSISQSKDEWGKEFCFIVNGEKIFAMGADYIPEDSILPRITSQTTRNLLQHCIDSNFNCIRIWGGGCYASDDFMSFCDEAGLIVWHDFMFACSTYLLTAETEKILLKEFSDNIIRLRNHASLGLFCGNNEMELAWLNWGIPQNQRVKQDYISIFERMLPDLIHELCPDIFYWPASPSCGGGFMNPNDENSGDVHYWDVWHGSLPFESYDEHYFRFCSEFGFEAFPCMETIKTFALEEDMNPFSRVMESHQKCECGNARILSYLSENYRYPYSFSELVYISQILQAEAIEYGVEHFRRNRGRCMGAIYWQLNDCWPGPSWASIDYGGNYKALQFRAGHFFAKTLLSAKKSAKVLTLNISHEGVESFDGKVKLSVCDNFFNIKFSKDYLVSVDRLSSKDIDTIDLNPYIDDFETYVAIELYDKDNNLISQNSTIFVKPKYYNYQNPTVTIQKSSDNNSIIVKSDCYTRGVYLSASGIDFSENFFDIVSAEGVRIPIRNEIENVIVDEINILAVNYIGK